MRIEELCNEHFFAKLSGVGKATVGVETNVVFSIYEVLKVKLGRDPFNFSDVGARRSGYHPPPLTGLPLFYYGQLRIELADFLAEGY